MERAAGTFSVVMVPGGDELASTVRRLDFNKTFSGDLQGTGSGLMLSCGDPGAGEAGYVAIESVDGQLGGRTGGFSLQQLGMMHQGSQTLHYEVVPGSGRGELRGISGTFHLTIDPDGTHRYVLEYQLPG
ncbi:MAG: DUF3224 domain-containing protein [Candidatus Dormibacteraeota bacterium]|nr:DUF3224 domain-containing protein [Candidatus Dormibacteraeota bacterium]